MKSKSTLVRILAMLLCFIMVAAMVVSCGDPEPDPDDDAYKGADTLVVGYDQFSAKFSPFFADTSYDQDVVGMTQLGLITTDREGNLILKGIQGEKKTYNGTEYTYDGIADIDVVQNTDGTVDYKITLRQDVKFSDGHLMNIDDVIFSIYVLSDPKYDGSSTFYSVPVIGMKEYRDSIKPLWKAICDDIVDEVATSQYYSPEQKALFEAAYAAAGAAFAQEIVDYCLNYAEIEAAPGLTYPEAMLGVTPEELLANEGLQVAFGMVMWGFDKSAWDLETTFPTTADYWQQIVDTYGMNNFSSDTGINYESAGSTIEELLFAELDKVDGGDALKVELRTDVNNIEGVVRTGDYSLTITTSEFSTATIYQLGLTVAPMHYYGSEAQYNYAQNKFGFTKGDLSTVNAKTATPMGAGPYKFVSYEDGVVTFVRNDNYYKGAPKIKNLKFVEVLNASDKVAGVVSGAYDASVPDMNDENLTAIKTANGGTLDGNVVEYYSVDFLGYGYIGISADAVKVGTDKASDASKNLRKAFATAFSVFREVTIDSYYGDMASVINYPISNTSWAAPKANDAGYQVAYSTDVNGDPIYTATMTQEQKEAAAKTAVIGFLKAAGFTFDEGTQKFTAAPEGARMEYTFTIPAGGAGDHPSYGIVTESKALLESIGITMNINDPTNTDDLWDGLDAGTVDFWAAAWGAAIDPDMYQIYHSDNSTNSNHYHIADTDLDDLIMAARESADNAYRKTIYKQCLEIVMDWGVEIPTYQRQECFILSSARIDISTVTPDITTYWSWMNDIENLEMLPAAK